MPATSYQRATSLPLAAQLSAKAHSDGSRWWLKQLCPCHLCGDPDWILCSWLSPSLPLVVLGIWASWSADGGSLTICLCAFPITWKIIEEPKLYHRRFSHCLRYLYPKSECLIWVPVIALPIPANDLRSSRWPKYFGFCHSCGAVRSNSWLLVSIVWGMNYQMGFYYLYCLCLSSQLPVSPPSFCLSNK